VVYIFTGGVNKICVVLKLVDGGDVYIRLVVEIKESNTFTCNISHKPRFESCLAGESK
jgi:hypothetical protein